VAGLGGVLLPKNQPHFYFHFIWHQNVKEKIGDFYHYLLE